MPNHIFKLEDAKLLFNFIAEEFNHLNLFITDIEPTKQNAHKEAVTIYYPSDKKQALGSIQYYGGIGYYKKRYVRTIELRFYFKFLEGKPILRDAICTYIC